ncbi:MAG: hypothetical protein R3326_06425, partial [Gemmatimonadota bacterium]|nr:hypothetical protein [Gemmatimonadota bacterium]
MNGEVDIRSGLRRLARLERIRRRRRFAWAGVAVLAFGVAACVLWEAWAPDALRAWGYAGRVRPTLAGPAGLVGGGCGSGSKVGAEAMARAVEQAFPQARGSVRDALREPVGGLGAKRVEGARAWLERRGVDRLDRAVGERERGRIARWRAVALAAVAFGVAVAAVQPAAARRAIGAVADPASLWRPASWSVEPGDASVSAGASVEGRARVEAAKGSGPLVLEWRSAGGPWRPETLATGSSGAWRWTDLRSSRTYRLRYGPERSPAYTIDVAAPFAVVEARARTSEGVWESLAGRVLPADEPVEIEGRANRPVESAGIEVDGRPVEPLEVRGARFRGLVTLP